tara:strand:- start:332 stop:1585 length:1254 start_codon:yes stop_codon:yes gene_type:complete
MDKIRIKGNADLFGSIDIPGSKNATLPIMVSCLLSKQNLFIKNIPDLQDVSSMLLLLQNFGVFYKKDKDTIKLNASELKNNLADYDLVRKMRASILVLGPLLTRFKEAKISLPGGCAIGNRPIDMHLNSLSKLGIKFQIENGFIIGKVSNRITGSIINLPFPSVGATENLLMTSSVADGVTIINNAAREPEIEDLAKALNSMGAKIYGAGNKTIKIEGVSSLKEANHTVMFDRIVAGTFIIAAVMLNKKFKVAKVNPKNLKSLINLLEKMNANLKVSKDLIEIFPTKQIISANLDTAPYPGFPTDLQAQIMSLMCIAKGQSKLVENIFENRFMHVSELNRLGAKIRIKNDTAYIKGDTKFKGAQVMASDLRASVSLVLAGLCAKGETIVNRVYHLDRGYEKIEKTLGKCGPIITREK